MKSIYNKQFVLSSKRLDLSGLKCQALSGCFLYYDIKLKVFVINKDERKLVLLGNAFDMSDADESAENMCAFDSFNVLETTRYWTGRWAVIEGNKIVNDATGLMPLFYTAKENNWYISSSLVLLSSILDVDGADITNHFGFDWQMLPMTIVKGIYQLLPFQYLQFNKKHLSCEYYNWSKNYNTLSTKEKCDKIIKLITKGCQNIKKYSHGEIIQALTGGKDSRLVFGILLKSGIKFSTYTSLYSGISHADKTIPKRLAEMYGIQHEFIVPKRLNKSLFEEYDKFTLKNICGVDREFYAHEQFNDIPDGSVVIRSGLFEAGQNFARTIARGSLEEFLEDYIKHYPILMSNELQYNAFGLWKEYVKNNNVEWIDIRDRFYIDQRVCGWASAIEHSLDLNDFISIQIANCAEVLSILLSATDEEREKLCLTYDSLKILDEQLLKVPINSVSIFDKVRRILNALKNPQKIKSLLSRL